MHAVHESGGATIPPRYAHDPFHLVDELIDHLIAFDFSRDDQWNPDVATARNIVDACRVDALANLPEARRAPVESHPDRRHRQSDAAYDNRLRSLLQENVGSGEGAWA